MQPGPLPSTFSMPGQACASLTRIRRVPPEPRSRAQDQAPDRHAGENGIEDYLTLNHQSFHACPVKSGQQGDREWRSTLAVLDAWNRGLSAAPNPARVVPLATSSSNSSAGPAA